MEQTKTFFTNKYVQSVLLFVFIVGGYVAYKNAEYYYDAVQKGSDQINEQPQPESSMEALPVAETEDTMYRGIHIMSDGTVMLGNGDVLENATTTSDGMIELSDGTQFEPAMDLRK